MKKRFTHKNDPIFTTWKMPPQSTTNSTNIHLDPINIRLAINGNRVDGPKIKRSTIPNVGFGLFADKDYKRNFYETYCGIYPLHRGGFGHLLMGRCQRRKGAGF